MENHSSEFKNVPNNSHHYYSINLDPPLFQNVKGSKNSKSNSKVKPPKDFLKWSIINVFLCCFFGVPALVYSIKSRRMRRKMNYPKAKHYSIRCLIMNIIATFGSILVIFFGLAILFAFIYRKI